MDDEQRLEAGQLKVRSIIEMLGAPKEHIENTLKEYVENLKEEKKDTITFLSENYEEADKQGKLFSAFVEIEAWFKDHAALMDFCFDSMPSSVSIIEPEKSKLDNAHFEAIMNDLVARLHDFDLMVKQVRAQNKLIDDNATAVFRNFIVFQLKKGDATIEELAAPMGVQPHQLKGFATKMVEEGVISLDKEKYSLQS